MSEELDLTVARLMRWNGDSPDFSPSTSERDSGFILDHIARTGWAATVFTSGWGGKMIVRCCILRTPTLSNPVDAIAETRPLAICQAFIQAMERWGDEAEN